MKYELGYMDLLVYVYDNNHSKSLLGAWDFLIENDRSGNWCYTPEICEMCSLDDTDTVFLYAEVEE